MQEPIKSQKKRVRNDLILIGALLLAALIGILCLLFLRPTGDSVKVSVDGKIYGTYSLSEDRRVEIRTGEDGEKFNWLVIQGGRAKMESASCPDGICVSHHEIHREGESIICLPNRVVVTVTTTDGDAPDIVA